LSGDQILAVGRANPQGDQGLSSTLQQTVEALREESLRRAEGDLIGSEDDLLARHRVSRPTLRQAAALVAQEQLLQVRRGVGGGYIARRPTGRAAAHMAAIFLSTRETSMDEIGQSTAPIRTELARLAAANLDDTSRRAFEDFLQREADGQAHDLGLRAFARSEREFGQLLGAASRNNVLSLFFAILYDLAGNIRPEHDVFLGRPERIKAYRERRTRLIEAILDGDPSVAELFANRLSEFMQSWRDEATWKAPAVTAKVRNRANRADQV
jgi:GntR family transcriptional regulator, transcriptional repressor for pyruvate dehydrogenase complex